MGNGLRTIEGLVNIPIPHCQISKWQMAQKQLPGLPRPLFRRSTL